MKKSFIIIFVLIILISSSAIVYSDPVLRFNLGKMLGIKPMPTVNDPNIVIEELVTGVKDVTQLTFIGTDIIFLEKSNGNVRIIRDGILQDKPLLKFNVFQHVEPGLLGTTVKDNFVFFYVTEADENSKPLGNHIYRYEWDGTNLVNKKLVNKLPAQNNPEHTCCHHGGAMITGLDGTVYAVIGDLQSVKWGNPGQLQNIDNGIIDDTSIILRVGLDEETVIPSQSTTPELHYRAIGIRNSFGLAIDPLTGNLWDTENGHKTYDEINLVPENFNSGWWMIMGPSSSYNVKKLPEFYNFTYSDPEFSWESVVAPTGLSFAGDKWGENYKDALFVGDYMNGILYKFTLNESRTGFAFENPQLQDLVLNKDDSFDEIVFSDNFGQISDVKFGSDGSLYVVSHFHNGAIYKLSLKN